MGLKELFSKLGKRKPEKPTPPKEAPPPAEAVKYTPARVPADAPACWEERWGRDMVTVSDPQGTCTVRLYGPFAKEGPQSQMLAAIRLKESDTYAAVYTSPDFGGWFVVGSLKAPWNPVDMSFLSMAMNPLLMALRLHNPRTLELPDRMRGVRDFRNFAFLERFLSFAHIASDDLDGTYVEVFSFFLDGCQYIDHVFCANKGEFAWKLECVIPAKDLPPGSDLCELPLYIFSTFRPNIQSKREDLTRDLPDSGGIFGRDAIHIFNRLDPLPPWGDDGKPTKPYLVRPDDPFSEQHFGPDMLQVRNDPCGYAVQLYGPAAGTAPVSRWLPHDRFDIRLDLFSSGEGDSWYLITTIRPKDGTSSKIGHLTSRDWHTGIGHTPNVELLLPERFRESSFFALAGENLPLDVRFVKRIQCPNASPCCFAFQMDSKVYKDYLLKIHKSGYIWILECIIPAQQGAVKPVPSEFVPPGYIFGSFIPLILGKEYYHNGKQTKRTAPSMESRSFFDHQMNQAGS